MNNQRRCSNFYYLKLKIRSLLYWHQFNAYKPSEVSKFEYIPVQVSKFYDLILSISNLFILWETNIKVLIWKKKCGYRYNVYYYIHGILSLFLCTLPAERIHFVENILVSYIVNFHERTYRWIFLHSNTRLIIIKTPLSILVLY